MNTNSILQQIRRRGFWCLDALKGKVVKNNYNEIREIIKDPCKKSSLDYRFKNLNNLLLHASKTVEFYSKYSLFSDLSDFPIIDKNTILNNYQKFKSNSNKYTKSYKVSSSGSTGIPFSVFQNKGKKIRNTADTIFFGEQGGLLVGDKLYYIKLWDYSNLKSKWLMFLQNIYAHSVVWNSKNAISRLIVNIEKDKSRKTLIGYPSFFSEICDYLKNENRYLNKSNIQSVISVAESLEESEKDRISKYFNAPVFIRYSNQENGILAQQTSYSDGRFVLNLASYFIEILESDSDKHVNPGCLGRIVVTDLFNFSMPMIRYDTGDMAVYQETKSGVPFLSKIYGRRTDVIFDTSGELVSPFIFYRVLDFTKAKQFQFIQKNSIEYIFKLNALALETDELKVRLFFKKYLGEDAIINFVYVDEIPLLSSGKRKKIINELLLKK